MFLFSRRRLSSIFFQPISSKLHPTDPLSSPTTTGTSLPPTDHAVNRTEIESKKKLRRRKRLLKSVDHDEVNNQSLQKGNLQHSAVHMYNEKQLNLNGKELNVNEKEDEFSEVFPQGQRTVDWIGEQWSSPTGDTKSLSTPNTEMNHLLRTTEPIQGNNKCTEASDHRPRIQGRFYRIVHPTPRDTGSSNPTSNHGITQRRLLQENEGVDDEGTITSLTIGKLHQSRGPAPVKEIYEDVDEFDLLPTIQQPQGAPMEANHSSPILVHRKKTTTPKYTPTRTKTFDEGEVMRNGLKPSTSDETLLNQRTSDMSDSSMAVAVMNSNSRQAQVYSPRSATRSDLRNQSDFTFRENDDDDDAEWDHEGEKSEEHCSPSIDITSRAVDEMLWEARKVEFSTLQRKIVIALECHRSPLDKSLLLLELHDKIIQQRIRLREDTYDDLLVVLCQTACLHHAIHKERRKQYNEQVRHSRSPRHHDGIIESSPLFLDEMWTVYRYMVDSGTKPSSKTIQHVMKVLSLVRAKDPDVEARAHSLFCDLDQTGLSPTQHTVTAYFEVCARNNVMHMAMGRYTDAVTRYEINVMPCVLIRGLVDNGQAQEAMKFISTMGNVPMTQHLLNAVLSAAQKVEPSSCFTFYRAFQGSGVQPSIETMSLLFNASDLAGDTTNGVRIVLQEMSKFKLKGDRRLFNLMLVKLAGSDDNVDLFRRLVVQLVSKNVWVHVDRFEGTWKRIIQDIMFKRNSKEEENVRGKAKIRAL